MQATEDDVTENGQVGVESLTGKRLIVGWFVVREVGHDSEEKMTSR